MREAAEAKTIDQDTHASSRHVADPTALLLAVFGAMVPLLPYGPRYLGLGAGSWVVAGFALLPVLWLGGRLRARRRRGRWLAWRRPRPVEVAILAWVGCVLGATILGLAGENALGSEVFAAHLAELPARLLGPMDQEHDVLFPLQLGLVYLLGPAAAWLTWRICARQGDGGVRVRYLLGGWLTGFAIVCGLALGQYVTGVGLHPHWVAIDPTVTRAHATLDDPNALGAYVTLGLGIVIGLLVQRWWSGRRPGWPLSALAVLAGAALLASVARAAWLAGFVAAPLLALAAVSWQRVSRGLVVVGAIVLGAAVVVGVSGSFLDEMAAGGISSATAEQAETGAVASALGARPAQWRAAVAMAVDHPLAGVGLGRYRRLLREYAPDLGFTENAHGIAFQIGAESGVLGLAVLAVALGAVAGSLLRGASQRGDEAVPWLAGGVTGLGALLVSQATGNAFMLPSIQILAGTLMGGLLALALPEHGPDDEVEPGVERSCSRALVPLALAVPLLTFAAAATLRPAPPAVDDPWGYSWGLHGPERPQRPWPTQEVPAGWSRLGLSDREVDLRRWAFRWSRDRAILDLRIPPGATAVQVPVWIPEPAPGATVRLWLFAGGAASPQLVAGGGRRLLEVPLDPAAAPPDRRLTLRLEVDGAFRPVQVGESGDDRLLGVRVWPVGFDF